MLPYNDLSAVERPLRGAAATEIACVITEAAAANMGVVPPLAGFNAGLAALSPSGTARCSSSTR